MNEKFEKFLKENGYKHEDYLFIGIDPNDKPNCIVAGDSKGIALLLLYLQQSIHSVLFSDMTSTVEKKR